jgi:peptidyl-prolyl cis-trans isomerase SDCCAG10
MSSSLYNLEPPPTAKVVLNTTSGDLTIELFAKQTPLASRNFLQHCLDGYYNNTVFHRLVPGFIIQGGDPTGSGHGGISALDDGEAFQDEIHSRLKFNRRGLLGMANEGPNSNGSQFFFTLDATPELQGKNTMFGRIEGDTIYNLMKMADAELTEEGSDRPLYPTKVTGAEILVNPFEDMVARAREAPRTKADEGKKEIKKRKKPAGKNVLSFGGEEGEEDAAPVLKKVKANPKLVVVEDDLEDEAKDLSKAKTLKGTKPKQQPSSLLDEDEDQVSRPPKAQPTPTDAARDEMDIDSPPPSPETKRNSKLASTNAEIAALKASMRRTDDTKSTKKQEAPKSALEAMIPATSTRGRRRGKATEEKGAMDMFQAFKARLETLPTERIDAADGVENGKKNAGEETNGKPQNDISNETDDDEAALCDLHFIANCQSCRSWDEQEGEGANGKGDAAGAEDDEDDAGWMAHQLSFAKDTLGKDLEWKRKMAEIEVIDPREKARTIKEESRKKKGKGKESREK